MRRADMMDAYCERVGPGLLAEPLNAVSNISFLWPLGQPGYWPNALALFQREYER
jgi:hypothetical protein